MPINWTGTLLSGYGVHDQLDRLSDMSDRYQQGSNELAQQALEGSQFTPYTTTSRMGTTGYNDNGGIDFNLDPRQEFLSQGLLTGATQRYGDAINKDYGQYQQEAYDAIRATQLPEEERARMALEGRLSAQGRGGITSNQYGGTPEQLAMAKAQAEAQNSAALQALGMADQRRMMDANLGGMFQQASYLPISQLMNQAQVGQRYDQLNQAGQLGGQNLASQIGLGGLQMGTNLEALRTNLVGGLFDNLSRAAGDANFDPLGQGIEWLWNQTPWGGRE